ncbi:putative leucine-rich repeat-containing protein DDB_G0290503 isoform X2 [Halyomorpha halys]|uniref:putative leucine-rich repeat-containing protein DDB_G0290503 isoform X2 n=1 Tax=Halyomorpha halys TaxID=286706 RepID=UPI0006D507E3|nr:uncharacterized protein MAL13P1.304-like isoform X2 [Halyomorpha halys]
MAKKRNVKANADEEDDRSCRESSSDGSVLDNPVKNGKSRKCKAQAMNKASNNLTNKSSSITKHLSESSCDSVACINGKEVSECNLGNRDKVTAPDDTNVNVSEQSVDPIENNSQEPIPDNKELIKTNSDKYSELITLLGGKEGDIDTFIKQYTIWQQSQSNTGKQIKAKKNATKSPTLQKPMKLKATRGTPLIKLTKKSISKKMNKNSDKKSPIPKKEDLKEPDSSFSEIKSNNTDSSCSSNPKDSNTIIKSGDSDEVNGQSNVTNIKDEHSMAEDIADCSKDVLTDSKPDAVHSKMKSKSLKPKIDGIKRGKKKPEVLSKEEVPKEGDKSVNVDTDFNESSKCTDDTKFNESSKHTDDTKFNESSKHTDDTKFENNGSKEIKVFDQEDQHATPKILNEEEKSVSECEDKLENDLINNDIVDLGKEDLVHEGEDKKSEIFENNSFLDITGSDNLLQGMIQENNNKENDISISDSSDNNKENDKLNDPSHLPSNDLLNTNQSICDKSLDSTGSVTQPCLNSKSQPSLSPCNIENNQFDEKDKAEDEVDTSAVLNINNSVLIERDSEIDIVWKRKRRMSDEKNECSKRTKRVIRLSETKTDEPQYVVSSSEPTCNKWNTEESNSFFEELIYSDEEKINNFTDNIFSHKSSMSVDEPTKGKVKNITLKSDLNKNTEKSNSIKNNYFDNKKSYDNPEHSKSVLDKKSIENSNGLKNNSFHKDINFDDSPKHSKGSSTTENMNTPHREINKEWKKKKCIETRDIDSSHKSKSRDKDKVLRISSKSKKQMKSKERTKSKKSSLNRSYDLEDLQKKDDLDKSYESMLKKVKKQLKTGRKSILETDLPVVEVSYKGESLHGILGSLYSVDFLTRFKLNQERQTDENILSSSHAQGILIRSLRPLCSEMLRTSSCKDPQNCRKEHKISNDFFSIMDKHDAWLIVAFILRISNCLSENLLTAILEFLSKYKAKRKILLVSRHVFQSHQNNYPVVKSLWEDILIALELCGLQRWEGIRSVIQFILDTQSHPKAESLSDGTLRPVRLAVVCSEIHYYNGRYKESIGVFINARLIDPDSEQWAIPGGNKEDYDIIAVMIVFLLNELIKKKIINIATMLFKAVIEAQSCLNEPIEIGPFFESLLYGLFELTEEYPETAVKLYMRVIAKDSSVTLYGLTYRALIILAYRTHKRAIIKDIFYKAIEEYVYPIIEGNENVIMLLRSLTEEEIIVYILEWVARFKEKQSESCDHEIQIKFKDAVLEDFLDNKVLGIPALLKEVDQTLPGALKRLDSVLKRLHIVFKQIKKDTFSVDPLSFQKFLNKIKVL